ncbi:MAG: glycosyl transferase [Spirochaetaceae bacterium]|nr:glycosyl transferase [Spirochaetaceae bacterium]|tara:strand:- start:22429 stop:23682 length:1254 start_codon:yes stop_codon:yes gene_type:complete
MKVVHLSHTDGGSGAGRAAYRLHQTLGRMGVESSMLVGQKRTDDQTVQSTRDSTFGRISIKLFEYLEARAGRSMRKDPSTFFSPARYAHFNPAKETVVKRADIVSTYWINGAFISPEGLGRTKKPVVWRLSDIWPFSGGCHYPGTCTGFQEHCGNCPQLKNPGEADASKKLWKRKWKAWQSLNLTVAAPSNWIANLANRSSLFGRFPIHVIPTGIDLEQFRPSDMAAARNRLSLPQDRLIILFGAMDPADDMRKGYHELFAALQYLAKTPLKEKVLAVLFGGNDAPNLPVPSVSLGRLNSESALCIAYNSADLVIVPSLEDNLPNVALEAISCGAPVAGFDVCGMPDIIKDEWNGKLANHKGGKDLGMCIAEALNDRERLKAMGGNARKHAESNFSLVGQARQYIDLYEKLLNERTN